MLDNVNYTDIKVNKYYDYFKESLSIFTIFTQVIISEKSPRQLVVG